MDKIIFSTFQIIQETTEPGPKFIVPKKDILTNIPAIFEHRDNDTFYNGTSDITEEYCWLSLEYGRAQPRRNEVINIETGTQSLNKRKLNETELLHQSFFYYSFENTTAYISDSRQQKLFQQLLNKYCLSNFVIKRLFKDYNEFIEQIKTISSISFTAYNDLFGSDSTRVRALADLTGTNAPSTFTINATYSLPLDEKFKQFLYSLKSEQNDSKLSKLVIAGMDENKLATLYNVDTFTNKIQVNLNKNIEGVFDKHLVLEYLRRALA